MLDEHPTLSRPSDARWGQFKPSQWGHFRPSFLPLAEQIHAALTHAPTGLTRTQLRDLFQRNLNGTHLEKALATLAHAGRATHQRVLTAGRPAELWTATPATAAPR